MTVASNQNSYNKQHIFQTIPHADHQNKRRDIQTSKQYLENAVPASLQTKRQGSCTLPASCAALAWQVRWGWLYVVQRNRLQRHSKACGSQIFRKTLPLQTCRPELARCPHIWLPKQTASPRTDSLRKKLHKKAIVSPPHGERRFTQQSTINIKFIYAKARTSQHSSFSRRLPVQG